MKLDIRADAKRGYAKKVIYHRNGIGGVGFYMIHFVYDKQELFGIVYTDIDKNGYDCGICSETAVINPMDINDCKRGYDYFGEFLYEVVKQYNIDKFGDNGENPENRSKRLK